jgi:hypothetical protein
LAQTRSRYSLHGVVVVDAHHFRTHLFSTFFFLPLFTFPLLVLCQTLTTTALHRDEVQVVRTTSSDQFREIQVIRTTAETNQKVGGWFTLVFDTTSTGGTVETSAPIMADAPPKATAESNGHSMQEILQAMQNIGTVNVERTVNPAHTDGYTWVVEFVGVGVNEGNIPQLKLGYSALSGTGADVEIETQRDGNVISGTFALGLDGALTQSIRHDASASVLQQTLEALPNVGVLAVTRTGPDYQGGFAWTVTFMDDMNTGIVPDMVPDPTHLSGVTSNVTVCTKGKPSRLRWSWPTLDDSTRLYTTLLD